MGIKKEHVSGVIVFYREKGEVLYLLLKNVNGRWGFPKGHVEKGEKPVEAALREAYEEAGFTKLRLLPYFRDVKKSRYRWPKSGADSEERLITVIYFLAESPKKDIRLSHEHQGYIWAKFSDALRYIKYYDAKNLLRHARKVILKQGI